MSDHAEQMDFLNAEMVGGLNSLKVADRVQQFRKELEKIPTVSKTACFPLYSLLMAVGNPTVDFFRWPCTDLFDNRE